MYLDQLFFRICTSKNQNLVSETVLQATKTKWRTTSRGSLPSGWLVGQTKFVRRAKGSEASFAQRNAFAFLLCRHTDKTQ